MFANGENASQALCAHDFVDLYWFDVGTYVAKPSSHGGIQGQVLNPDQNFIVIQGAFAWSVNDFSAEDIISNRGCWSLCEYPACILDHVLVGVHKKDIAGYQYPNVLQSSERRKSLALESSLVACLRIALVTGACCNRDK
jgi:hypothetical protein